MLRFLLLRNSCESGGPPSTFAVTLEDLRPVFVSGPSAGFSGLLNPYRSLDLGHRINRVKVGHVPHNSCAQGWDSFILQRQSAQSCERAASLHRMFKTKTAAASGGFDASVQRSPSQNRPLRSKPWDSRVDCLTMSVPSATMFPSPRPDSPHVGGIQWPRRHRERAPGEGRRQGQGVPEPRVGRCSARASAAVMPAWFEFFVLDL